MLAESRANPQERGNLVLPIHLEDQSDFRFQTIEFGIRLSEIVDLIVAWWALEERILSDFDPGGHNVIDCQIGRWAQLCPMTTEECKDVTTRILGHSDSLSGRVGDG